MGTNPSVSDDTSGDSDQSSNQLLNFDEAIQVLREGDIELLARMPYSSNATFLVQAGTAEKSVSGIYKPVDGERPLWDFPPGLYKREIAAYELSQELGWNVVPPTVERVGPHGVGSVQLFIDADFEQHHFTLVKDPRHHPSLQKLCVLDLLANNTDRKAGHCLLSRSGSIFGIDHGLCFSSEFKLRTVIWDFANQPIDEALMSGVEQVCEGSVSGVADWLEEREIEALIGRAQWLRERPFFPEDDGYRWPWPLI
tara:strand:- start:1013 stop:1774 length:762 start_codon:yes stop_codon:yes gene_type:complete